MPKVSPAALALLALFLGGAALAQPACVTQGLEVFPKPGSVVPTNFRIVLEGAGEAQALVDRLVGQDLVLQAPDDRVSVRVVRGWKSAVGRTAVLLRPRAALKANRTYRLMLEARLPGAKLAEGGVPSWATGKGPDARKPRWVDPPAVSEGKYSIRDGKLTRYLKLRMALLDESSAYAVVTIRRVRGAAAAQTYVVPISDGEGWVGHDGCSGGFSFEDGRAYLATVEAYDVAGNLAPPVPPVEFQAPRQVTP